VSSRPSRSWWLKENIKKQKLVKVKITSKVSRFVVGAKEYLPGDVDEPTEIETPFEIVATDETAKKKPERKRKPSTS